MTYKIKKVLSLCSVGELHQVIFTWTTADLQTCPSVKTGGIEEFSTALCKLLCCLCNFTCFKNEVSKINTMWDRIISSGNEIAFISSYWL